MPAPPKPGIFDRTKNYLINGIDIQASSGGTSDLLNPANWLVNDLLGGVALTKSGSVVSGLTAMTVSPWYAGIRNIAEDIAKLPVNVFQISGDDQKENLNQTIPMATFKALSRRASPNVSSMSFYETMIHFAISWGNGFAEIVRNGRGEVAEFHIIHPSRVKLFFNDLQELFYEVTVDTTIQGRKIKQVTLPARDILHIHGLGGDGIIGYSLFFLAQSSLGISIAAQDYAATYYSNGTALSGTLNIAGKLDKAGQARLRASWRKLHQGNACNSHDIAILQQGAEFKPISNDPQKSQLLKAREFQILEAARWLRMPPHKIASMEKTTLSNVEQQNIDYHTDTLVPWIRRVSQELTFKLFPDQMDVLVIHEINALSLGDSKTRSEVVARMRTSGILTANQGRAMFNMNKADVKGMDDYMMQSNITTVPAISEGANMGGGQPRQVQPNEGRRASAIEDVGDVLSEYETAKSSTYPIFIHAATKIIHRESKAIQTHMKKDKGNLKGFMAWANAFFDRQKIEIINEFGPCVKVFVNAFKSEKIQLDFLDLKTFADQYAEDGIKSALNSFESGEYDDLKGTENSEKLASLVIKMVGTTAKRGKSE